ncbi:MAG: site-specific DNA-methyltransferase, partial [Desulfobacterales bacterium]|nr:site-specific DNA-methyltransferase [Desulfobacterales bacterium]
GWNIYEKARKRTTKAKSIWTETEVIHERGTVEVGALGFTEFGFPKPVGLIKKVVRLGSAGDGLIMDYFAGSGSTGHAVIDLNREDGGKRKYILVEMGDYFDTVLKPRMAKAAYSDRWKNGKPVSRHTGASHCFKYIRLESYEDALNNSRFDDGPVGGALPKNAELKKDHMLHYFPDVETRGDQSLLNIDAFADPAACKLRVKKPGSEEYVVRNVDLMETFNYLIGLHVARITAPRSFSASFKREPDPELPEDQHTRLTVDGEIREDAVGPWWFREIQGWLPESHVNPDNGQREKALIIWRKLTGDPERDNLMLDQWLRKQRDGSREFNADVIYVNGGSNPPNLKLDG